MDTYNLFKRAWNYFGKNYYEALVFIMYVLFIAIFLQIIKISIILGVIFMFLGIMIYAKLTRTAFLK